MKLLKAFGQDLHPLFLAGLQDVLLHKLQTQIYYQHICSNLIQKGLTKINQVEIIAFIAQTALTYIFVAIATGNAQKQTVIDQKTDLRTTKEDLMSELKDSRQTLLRQNDTLIKATVDIIQQTIRAEIEQAMKEKQKGQ